MDILCRTCGEPWEFDSLHEMSEFTGEPNISYAEAMRRFQSKGCEAFGSTHNTETVGSLRAEAAGAMYDLLGDDMDGAAAMLEDFDMLGMLE